MPSTRLTLIKNAQQKTRAAILFKSDAKDPIASILTVAKNKLRIKNPERIFIEGGDEISTADEFAKVLQNDRELFISGGEDYIGLIKEEASNGEALKTATVANFAQLSHVEPEALLQLQRTATLEGMRHVFGMPDLHQGNTYPIGATFVTEDRIYPALIGGDIGCGMVLYSTRLYAPRFKPQRAIERLRGIEGRWDGPIKEMMNLAGVEPTEFDELTMGTIGGGNHFAEFQHVTEVFDKAEFARANLSTDLVYLLVHSGSRRLGGSILDAHTAKYKHAGLDPSSPEGQEYLRQHDNACKWARLNREVIARRVMEKLNADDNALVNDEQRKVEKVLDIWHNSVEKKEWNTGTEQAKQLWVHRKGAAPSDRGLVVIPGSRGACSFLVMPVGDQNENGYSLAHGAGRQMSRTEARTRRESPAQLRTTKLGSKVICDDETLLFEEAPYAYKKIDDVVRDLTEIHLFAKIVAVLTPLVTYKMRNE